MTIVKPILFVMWLISYSLTAVAELNINISKDAEMAVPIAVVPFGNSNSTPTNVSAIIQADLANSGYFQTLAENKMLTSPSEMAAVKFKNWQVLGQEYLLVGNISQQERKYDVLFQLLDVNQGNTLMEYKISAGEKGLRRAAHQISDLVYEKLTGKKGIFGAKIAFVSTKINSAGQQLLHELQIADVDGFNAQVIMSSSEPIMSPAWSPDKNRIAYVSFENHKSSLFIQTLATGKRIKVSAFPGINGAPAWSPNGRKLALTLSKDGSPNIYVVDTGSKKLIQITKNSFINTEPTWSPDGRTIVFTSNQDGKPQLYKVASTGGNAARLTSHTDGNYNANASFSPDGKKIAFVHAVNNNYKIAIMDLATRKINVLTTGGLDESPSFSANGAMVLYANLQHGKSGLAAVSIDGRIHQPLPIQQPNVRDPIWVP